ncbi:MAG: ATP phosphoribosyltransferase regulatory subunit [Chitinophagaceae bacterium]
MVRLNSRKILTGIAQYCGAEEKLVDITTAIDKLDKIGQEGVQKELSERGLSDGQIADIIELIGLSTLESMEQAFEKKQISTGLTGIQELRNTLNYHDQLKQVSWTNSKVEIDFTLARGLSYYTGVIVEVICADDRVQMGSIGGGGRYDDLTGLFGLKNLSGVGVSFGIDRIYDVMEQLQLFPETLNVGTQVIVINSGGTNEAYALSLLNHLRVQGISSEIYTDNAKFDKQMKYAFNRGIPYVVIAENEEQHTGTIRVKQFGGDGQERMTIDVLIERLK